MIFWVLKYKLGRIVVVRNFKLEYIVFMIFLVGNVFTR